MKYITQSLTPAYAFFLYYGSLDTGGKKKEYTKPYKIYGHYTSTRAGDEDTKTTHIESVIHLYLIQAKY